MIETITPAEVIEKNMLNMYKPIGMNCETMKKNHADKKTLLLKTVVSDLNYALYHNPYGRYRASLVKKSIINLNLILLDMEIENGRRN